MASCGRCLVGMLSRQPSSTHAAGVAEREGEPSAPGPDGITLEEFETTFAVQWPSVRQELLEGTYEPSPARRKSIPKPDGTERHLGILNVQN